MTTDCHCVSMPQAAELLNSHGVAAGSGEALVASRAGYRRQVLSRIQGSMLLDEATDTSSDASSGALEIAAQLLYVASAVVSSRGPAPSPDPPPRLTLPLASPSPSPHPSFSPALHVC